MSKFFLVFTLIFQAFSGYGAWAVDYGDRDHEVLNQLAEAYYKNHNKPFPRPGQAWLSLSPKEQDAVRGWALIEDGIPIDVKNPDMRRLERLANAYFQIHHPMPEPGRAWFALDEEGRKAVLAQYDEREKRSYELEKETQKSLRNEVLKKASTGSQNKAQMELMANVFSSSFSQAVEAWIQGDKQSVENYAAISLSILKEVYRTSTSGLIKTFWRKNYVNFHEEKLALLLKTARAPQLIDSETGRPSTFEDEGPMVQILTNYLVKISGLTQEELVAKHGNSSSELINCEYKMGSFWR